ncbi:hypothetical protein F4860DRAFT_434616 [Xylaria cubensis]|nr:hypothetical protein F4860DRAFT_434616 [Xylaria cubensis]
MASVHPTFDPCLEKDVLLSFSPMMRAISQEGQLFTSLPQRVDALPNQPKIRIETTTNYAFSPLETADFEILRSKVDDAHQEVFAAPTRHNNLLVYWVGPVIDACRVLSSIRDQIWGDDEEGIHCAVFSHNSHNPVTEAQCLLLEGHPSPHDPMWFVNAFLVSTPRRYGCILSTWTWERLTSEQVLRSEMLTLLLLLEFAGIRAVCTGESCMVQTVFMLSFTYTQVRVLEAHVEKPGVIAVSVREVLDGVPTEAERDRKLQELVAWTMYTDGDNRYSSPGVSGVATKTTSIASNVDTEGSDDPGHESDRDECSATTSETADTSYTQESERDKEEE